MLDGTSPSRETFLSVMSNIEAILIRATYHSIMGSASLRDLYMETSTSNPTTYGRMPQVESCQCPEGYTGSSCEQCAPGYLLQEGGVGRRCTRCSCNNHADSCDPRTGQCLVGTTVHAKDIRPSDLTDVQCLWSDVTIFTSDQNVWCLHVLLKILYKYASIQIRKLMWLNTVWTFYAVSCKNKPKAEYCYCNKEDVLDLASLCVSLS
jgi:hypothetical protein